MTIAVVRAADQRVMPWRNGLGTTREIAVGPAGAADRFAWRVSIATIERPCPFSPFPGYDRTIMVIDGAGMVLEVDGRRHRIERHFEPFAFAGEATVACAPVAGPIDDYNVMVVRARCHAVVAIARPGPLPVALAPVAGTLLITCLDGVVRVDGTEAVLAPRDSIVVEPPSPTPPALHAGDGPATVAVVAILPRRGSLSAP